jgi:hypothetical protein
MAREASGNRGILRSLWRPEERRSARILAEHRAERRAWRCALRRGEEAPARPARIGQRDLEVAPLTLRALVRWAFRAGLLESRRSGVVPRDERLASALAMLPAGRLRAAARRHLLQLDFFCDDTWGPWHVRHARHLAPWQQRRMNRYQDAIPTRYRWERPLGSRVEMLSTFVGKDELRALFNQELARAHRPPSDALRWHSWVDRLFRRRSPELMLSPPRLLTEDEAKLQGVWEGSSPEFELHEDLWIAAHRRQSVCLSSPFRPGKYPDPRHHPEGWRVLTRFFHLWRAGVRSSRELRRALGG